MKVNLLKKTKYSEQKKRCKNQYSWRECLEVSSIPDNTSSNNLEETVLKNFSEAGVTVDWRNADACHHLNQPANPEKVIIKLSKRKIWPG